MRFALVSILLLLITSSHSFGQYRGQTQVPEEVLNSFFEDFPRAQRASWRRAQAYYLADFANRGYRMTAYYTLAGKWVRTNILLRFEDLPKITKDHFRRYYSRYRINSIQLNDQPGAKYYEIKIQGAGGARRLRYGVNGYPIQ